MILFAKWRELLKASGKGSELTILTIEPGWDCIKT